MEELTSNTCTNYNSQPRVVKPNWFQFSPTTTTQQPNHLAWKKLLKTYHPLHLHQNPEAKNQEPNSGRQLAQFNQTVTQITHTFPKRGNNCDGSKVRVRTMCSYSRHRQQNDTMVASALGSGIDQKNKKFYQLIKICDCGEKMMSRKTQQRGKKLHLNNIHRRVNNKCHVHLSTHVYDETDAAARYFYT